MILKSENGTLSVSSGNVISAVTKLAGTTESLTGLGGYGSYTFSMLSNPSGGSINPTTGVYTAGGSIGTDIAQVADEIGNTAIITITVQ